MKEYLTTSGEGVTVEYNAPEGTDSIIYTITDMSLNEILFADEAVYNEDTELFEIEINDEICRYDRKLRIDLEIIDYGTAPVNSVGGSAGSYSSNYIDISLVRPYVSAQELADELGLTITDEPTTTSEVNLETIKRWERQARMYINSKIEKCNFQYKEVSVVGQDTDVLYLGERVESFDKIVKDDEVVYDSIEGINLLDYTLEISKSKLQIKPRLSQYNIDEGKAVTAIYDPGYFEKGSIYSIRGEFGWKNVPEEIREATIIMVDDMRCNDWSYRNKGLTSVKNDSFAIEFGDTSFAGTGNLLVDSLLSEFKSWRFMSI